MSDAAFQVGFGEVDITPAKPVQLAGYYFGRLSTGVHDRLYARSMAVSDGKDRVVLCVCDLVDLVGCLDPTLKWLVPEVRKLVQAGRGLPAESLIVATIHSHTGPDLALEPDYTATVPKALAESVRLALADLRPRELSAARGRAEGIQFVRRYRMKDGSVRTNPGSGNPEIAAPIGTVDPDVHVLLASQATKAVGGLAHFALHCDTVGGTEISADWTHYLREGLGATLGAPLKLLTPIGPCGDVNHWNVFADVSLRGFAETERLGRRIALGASEALKNAKPVSAGPVVGLSKRVALPVRKPSAQELKVAQAIMAKPAPTDVDFTMDRVEARRQVVTAGMGGLVYEDITVLTFGNVALVGIPAELFTELGRKIKRESPFEHTLVCTLANGNIGYVPARQNYEEGGYEVASSVIAPGGGEAMAAAAITLLNQAASRRKRA